MSKYLLPSDREGVGAGKARTLLEHPGLILPSELREYGFVSDFVGAGF